MFTSSHWPHGKAFDADEATRATIRRVHAWRAALAVVVALALLAVPWMIPDEIEIAATPSAPALLGDPAGVGAPGAGGVAPVSPGSPEELQSGGAEPLDLSLG